MNVQMTSSTLTIIRIGNYPSEFRVKMYRLHWLDAVSYTVDISGMGIKCFSTLADALDFVLSNVNFTETEREALFDSLI